MRALKAGACGLSRPRWRPRRSWSTRSARSRAGAATSRRSSPSRSPRASIATPTHRARAAVRPRVPDAAADRAQASTLAQIGDDARAVAEDGERVSRAAAREAQARAPTPSSRATRSSTSCSTSASSGAAWSARPGGQRPRAARFQRTFSGGHDAVLARLFRVVQRTIRARDQLFFGFADEALRNACRERDQHALVVVQEESRASDRAARAS